MFNLISIIGPTASGKTRLAVKLASRLDAEIISADSRQVYKGMDIGTGKDLEDYILEGKKYTCHLLDIVEAGYKYNVYEYQKDFLKVWEDINQRNVFPILCGGSGLYIEAILKGYKLLPVPANEELRSSLSNNSLEELTKILSEYKKLHNTTDVDTVKRAIRAIEIEEYYATHPLEDSDFPQINSFTVGLDVDREIRRKRITERLHARLKEGMIEEVQVLLNKGIHADDLIYYGLEYKYITLYLTDKLSYKEMVEKLNVAIHQFAKRQMTWFRKMERDGFDIFWVDGLLPDDEKTDLILNEMEKRNKE